MQILGAGVVCARGRGREAAITDPGPPLLVEVPFQDEPFAVRAVPPAALKDGAVLKGMRRADRFSKMAVLAAHDALVGCGGVPQDGDDVGIVLATAYGPHQTTFAFLDEILDYGDAGVSPTVFSGSVHNAAVSRISRTLGIKGPTWTVTGFTNPFLDALAIAEAWLFEGRCERVLVGVADEIGAVLEYVFSRMSTRCEVSGDSGCGGVPGEGSAFFCLSSGDSGGIDLRETRRELIHETGSMVGASAIEQALAFLSSSEEA